MDTSLAALAASAASARLLLGTHRLLHSPRSLAHSSLPFFFHRSATTRCPRTSWRSSAPTSGELQKSAAAGRGDLSRPTDPCRCLPLPVRLTRSVPPPLPPCSNGRLEIKVEPAVFDVHEYNEFMHSMAGQYEELRVRQRKAMAEQARHGPRPAHAAEPGAAGGLPGQGPSRAARPLIAPAAPAPPRFHPLCRWSWTRPSWPAWRAPPRPPRATRRWARRTRTRMRGRQARPSPPPSQVRLAAQPACCLGSLACWPVSHALLAGALRPHASAIPNASSPTRPAFCAAAGTAWEVKVEKGQAVKAGDTLVSFSVCSVGRARGGELSLRTHRGRTPACRAEPFDVPAPAPHALCLPACLPPSLPIIRSCSRR